MHKVTFYCLVAFIAATSALDGFLNVLYPVTSQSELNPVAAGLLSCTHDNIVCLLVAKGVGTTLVCLFLLRAYFYRKEVAYWIGFVVACFQALFLTYMVLA